MGRLAFSPHVGAALAASGLSVAVTGGGGWIGQGALEMLEGALGDDFAARVRVFGSRARSLELRSGRQVACAPLARMAELPPGPWAFLHFAFLTRDRLGGQSVDSFIAGNQAITDTVAAAAERVHVRGMVSVSSGAVHLPGGLEGNAYGAMKLREEERLSELAGRLGAALMVPRLFALSGPFVNKLDTYALASILVAALKGGPVVLRAGHRVERSYIHVRDVVDLCVAGMLAGDCPQAPFDACGSEVVEMGELARRALAVLGRPAIAIERPPVDATRVDRYTGDPATVRALAARHGIRLLDLDAQIASTAEYLHQLS
ncbi:MAG: NAD-dependent epimerase/dehydratase family protein [Solirubrobacterales bacterium]